MRRIERLVLWLWFTLGLCGCAARHEVVREAVRATEVEQAGRVERAETHASIVIHEEPSVTLEFGPPESGGDAGTPVHPPTLAAGPLPGVANAGTHNLPPHGPLVKVTFRGAVDTSLREDALHAAEEARRTQRELDAQREDEVVTTPAWSPPAWAWGLAVLGGLAVGVLWLWWRR